MTKRLGSLLLVAMLAAGCASHCSDGYTSTGVQLGPVGMGTSRYRPCHEQCLDPIDPKPCGCSRACPCWTRHQ